MRRRGTKRPRSHVNRGTELWWKGRFNTGGLCRPGWLGSTLLGSNHNNCNHTGQPHVHALLLNHTGIPECTHKVTKEARTFPQAYGHSSHSSPSPLDSHGGFKADLLRRRWRGGVGFPGPGEHDGGPEEPLGDMRGGRWVSPETPAPFGVLLTQDLLLALALLLRAQVAVLLLQEPHGGPAVLLKVTLVF